MAAGASLGGNMVGTQQPMSAATPLGTGTLQPTQQPQPRNPQQQASAPGAQFLNQAGGMLNQQQNNPAWYAQDNSPGVNVPGGYQTSFETGPAVDMTKTNWDGTPVSSVGQADPYMKSMEDAYYQRGAARLDPQYQERQQGLEGQLAAMGLTRGSEAWTREMDRMGRDRNDAYGNLSREAILTSGAEAQRAQGMDIASGNFANDAAQRDFANKQASIDAYNKAQAQGFGQNQAAAQFGNTALSDAQRAAQGWGSLAAQDQASRNQLAGSLAGTEANRYGSDQSLKGSLAQASATLGAASSAASASKHNALIAQQTAREQQLVQRYGIDQETARSMAANETQRYGIDTSAGTAERGQNITRELGLGQIGEQRYATDTRAATDTRGQDLTARGQDQNYALGQGRLTLDTNAQNYGQADNDYWRPIKTQQALNPASSAVGAPSFGNVPGQVGGTTSNPNLAGAGYSVNAQGQLVNQIGQVIGSLGGALIGG